MEIVLFLKCASNPIQIALGKLIDNKLIIDKDLNLVNFLLSRDLSLIVFDLLKEYIKEEDCKIRIYLLSGPGSYTAVRLQTLIVKTLVFIYPFISLFHNNTLNILLQINKNNINKTIKRLSLVYAYSNKYYLAFENKNCIEYKLIDKNYFLKNFNDDYYILNGNIKSNKFFEKINKDNINRRIDYKVWLDNSSKVNDIDKFDPFYFDHDEIGVN